MRREKETDIIRRAREGDTVAFGEIVRRSQNLVYATAFQVLKDPSLAGDAAQEAFVAAYRSLDDLRRERSFPSWPRRIARNVALAARRERGRFGSLEEAGALQSPSPDIAVASEKEEREADAFGEEVSRIVSSLSDTLRFPVLLRCLDGPSTGDAARFLGIKEGALRKPLPDGKKKLQERIVRMGGIRRPPRSPARAFHDTPAPPFSDKSPETNSHAVYLKAYSLWLYKKAGRRSKEETMVPCIWERRKELNMGGNEFFRAGILLSTVILVNLFVPNSPFAQEKPQKSLYERLGGVYNIAPVVDEFLETLYVNDVLNANPKIKAARDRVPISYLKYQVTSLVCHAAGGPQNYTGRSMKEAHAHLDITEREWQAMRADFKKVLDKFKVPEQEQKELFAIVESTKKDIVLVSGERKQ